MLPGPRVALILSSVDLFLSFGLFDVDAVVGGGSFLSSDLVMRPSLATIINPCCRSSRSSPAPVGVRAKSSLAAEPSSRRSPDEVFLGDGTGSPGEVYLGDGTRLP